MKRFFFTSVILLLGAICGTVSSQGRQDERLGLPGDNLNLYAVMKLFQESKTLESFEKKLNDENSMINNLDLNGDNVVDYITVSDYVDGNVHNIVLRVAVTPEENQDVAVFTVQKMEDGTVQIQLIGDEELYGKNYIIEPVVNDGRAETPNPGYTGTYGNVTYVYSDPVYVSDWPLISYLFMPGYYAWHSPWYWGCEFAWWNPWHPCSWDYYYGYHYNWYPRYYAHYRMGDHFRYNRYDDFYYRGIRSYSHRVSEGIRDGRYRGSYGNTDQRREGAARFARVQSESRYRTRQSGNTVNRTRDFTDRTGRNSNTSGSVRNGRTYNNSAPSGNNRTFNTRERTMNNNGVTRQTDRGTYGTSYNRGNSSSLKTAQNPSGRYSRADVNSSSKRYSSSDGRVSSGSSGRQSMSSGRSSGSYGGNRSSGSVGSNRSTGSYGAGRSSGSMGSSRSSGSYGGGRSSGSIGSSRSSGSYGGGRSSGSYGGGRSSGSGGGGGRSSGSGGSSRR